MIFAKSSGRVYYVPGSDGNVGSVMRYDPAKPAAAPDKVDASLGLRAATQETPQGLVYTVFKGGKGAKALMFTFNTKTEKAEEIGPAAVGTQDYITSLDVDPTGRYLYYIPGGTGGKAISMAAAGRAVRHQDEDAQGDRVPVAVFQRQDRRDPHRHLLERHRPRRRQALYHLERDPRQPRLGLLRVDGDPHPRIGAAAVTGSERSFALSLSSPCTIQRGVRNLCPILCPFNQAGRIAMNASERKRWRHFPVALMCIAVFVGESVSPTRRFANDKDAIIEAWQQHSAARSTPANLFGSTGRRCRATGLFCVPGAPNVPAKDREGLHVSEVQCTFSLDGDKTRLDLFGNAPTFSTPTLLAPFERIYAFDGKITKELWPNALSAGKAQGLLQGERNEVVEHPWARPFILNLRPLFLLPTITKWEIGSAKGNDGRVYITLSEPGALPAKPWRQVYWLDPAKDFFDHETYPFRSCHAIRSPRKPI